MKGYIMEQITINEIQKYANELFLNIGGNVAHYSFIEYLNDLKNQEIIYDFYVIDSEDKFQYVIKFIPMAYYHQEIVDRNSVFIYKPEKIEDKQDLLYKKYNELEQKLKDYLYTTGTILCAKQKVIEGKLDEAQAFLKMQFDYYVKLYSKMSKKDLDILLRIKNAK